MAARAPGAPRSAGRRVGGSAGRRVGGSAGLRSVFHSRSVGLPSAPLGRRRRGRGSLPGGTRPPPGQGARPGGRGQCRPGAVRRATEGTVSESAVPHTTDTPGPGCRATSARARLAGPDPDLHRQDLWEAVEGGDHPFWTPYVQAMPFDGAPGYRFRSARCWTTRSGSGWCPTSSAT
ncbi:catalase [Kitasatospora sp. NPDC005751]|uniref:catalase n=1 Tax=Kitasatospora sp. NPDC005751 TaxID=3157064 RepID=UPI0033D2116F